MQDFFNIFTISGLLALVNIIIIDIVMSGDNAIVIGMATRNLPDKLRKKAILVGIFLATIMRIGFALFATILLNMTGLRFAGGVLLLYVVWKFYKELRIGGNNHEENNKQTKNIGFMAAIYTIIIADVSMSLDNVLAVAGASHGNIITLGIGLVFSIILMAFASNYIAKSLNKYPIIQWIGLLVILFVAIEMLIKGTPDIENKIQITNLFPFFIFIASMFFVFLHQKYIKPINEEKIKLFTQNNYSKIIISFLGITFLFINLGDKITYFINQHEVFLYFINFIILFIFLEIVSIFKTKK
ncbi:MAG: TerC family protein [Candidatus Gracilibacteria bacterium]|nr:TerC family protein [Candidatus Gracilibacteria bacterium]